MRKVTIDDTKDLLKELDLFLVKVYSAYVCDARLDAICNPRLTVDEIMILQSKIRLIAEME